MATSNNVSSLPPELLRKGRFDEIFYVDLPSKEERKEIFKIHLEKRHRKAEKYDIQKYADQSAGFSGSEIEEIIVSALYDAYDANRELVDSDLENTIKTMIPLSQTMEEQIKSIREWAKLRARRASSIEWENETKKKRQLEV